MSSQSDAVEQAHQALRAAGRPLAEARTTLQQAAASVESAQRHMARVGGQVVAQQLRAVWTTLQQALAQVRGMGTTMADCARRTESAHRGSSAEDMLAAVVPTIEKAESAHQQAMAVHGTIEPLPQRVAFLLKGTNGGEAVARSIHHAVDLLGSASQELAAAQKTAQSSADLIRGPGNF